MEEKKINITSGVLEKGLEVAKDFVDKLIMPTIEESGLLIKDRVVSWRFNNQIKILNKAQKYCEKNNISLKQISLKLLVPLLDYSSIEEDDVLQDKWAILLSNLVDSEQNIENHVFPYILSQLSKNEFLLLEETFDKKQIREKIINEELARYRKDRLNKENEYNAKIESLKQEKSELEKKEKDFILLSEMSKMDFQISMYEREKNSLNNKEFLLLKEINALEPLSEGALRDFELSNLIRLGLTKEEKEFYANPQTLQIPKEHDGYWGNYVSVDLDVDLESNIEIVLTELGELFIRACKEKSII